MKNSKGFESLPNLQEAPPSQPMPNSENRVNVHVEPGSKEGFGIVCGTSPSGIEKLLVQIKVHVYSGSGSFPKKRPDDNIGPASGRHSKWRPRNQANATVGTVGAEVALGKLRSGSAIRTFEVSRFSA